jgi:Domain of unknown function (DUF1877)
MGMAGCFAAIDPDTQRKIRNDPSLMEGFLYPDGGDGEPEHSVDVDKAWHGIHFMLTGKAHGGEGPLALAIMGGDEIGEEMGYGPARFLEPKQVQEVAAALEKLTIEEFEKGFRPAEMTAADIYPEVIWERDGKDALNYVLENFQQMVVFYRDTAARGDGAVLWLA